MRNRVGIFGGAFDPIHNGHMHAAEVAKSSFELDKVIFVPSSDPPHKDISGASKSHRWDMAAAATRSRTSFVLNDIEYRNSGTNYAYTTVKTLTEERPEDKLFLIMGADSLLGLNSWYKAEELVKLIDIICISREGYCTNHWYAPMDEHILTNITLDITRTFYKFASSSLIRESIITGEPYRYSVPEPVYTYIENKQPYSK